MQGPMFDDGEGVDPVRLLVDDVTRLVPGPLLAGALQGLAEPQCLARSQSPAESALESFPASASESTRPATPPLEALDGTELRHLTAGWERLVSWARAAQARVARELMARVDGPLSRDSVAGEIADELHVTTSEAWQIAMRGEGTGRYPALDDALATGKVDAKKTDTFLRAGAGLTPAERGEAIADLLPVAPRRTWKWISEQMNARAAELHGAKARRRDVTDRCNVWAEQAGPGRGRIVADLPVTDAALAFNAVQSAAKALQDTPGETRPLGALRAAAFSALLTGRLVLPCSDHDAADDADDSAPLGAPRDAVGGTRGDADGPPAEPPGLVEPVLDTDLVPVPDDPRGVHLTGTAAGTRLRVIDVPATVHVTVPATVLLDPADMTPGILDGIGPVPADDAARIAADGTWRRLLTDPVSGILTDYSSRSYAPGAVLRAAVTARDLTCTFPGCDRPARSGGRAAADLDHIEPFDKDHRYLPGEPGQTRAANLHPLCRRHHNVKTHAGWHVARDPDTGITRWTAPTGRDAVVHPTVVDPVIRYALGRGMTLARAPQRPQDGDAAGHDGPPPPGAGPPPF
ncbi:HNH endonuclease signature motif containing protein [Myceligenerans xiligouense]|uniref:HNH nuclease domain-containing protein n=1 Tax=Myceligenerans xiligouense TaxID=253184 RepID=A0A3N4YLJ0_9MICO|nr:HNH endonuclease signature motif containing protein [Myceligenerans xiligouense]RPF21523.1 hypothetical protein EDD34_2154 [Myceligenerans xiligouense]